MLDAYIIEDIRRREQDRESEQDRPKLHIEMDLPPAQPDQSESPTETRVPYFEDDEEETDGPIQIPLS